MSMKLLTSFHCLTFCPRRSHKCSIHLECVVVHVYVSSEKGVLSFAFLTVNYHLFIRNAISYRFVGDEENVILKHCHSYRINEAFELSH